MSHIRRERRKKLKCYNSMIDHSVIEKIKRCWPLFKTCIIKKVTHEMNLTSFDESNDDLKIKIFDQIIYYLQQDLIYINNDINNNDDDDEITHQNIIDIQSKKPNTLYNNTQNTTSDIINKQQQTSLLAQQ